MKSFEELKEIAKGKYSKWIKVPSFNPKEIEDIDEQYCELERHHIEETGFLIKLCQELAKEVIELRQCNGYTL
jgi:hypothetical protein